MKPSAIAVLLLALAMPSPGAAQQRPVDGAAAVAVARLRPGSVIRATLPDGQKITGRFTRAGDGLLGIRRFDQPTETLRLDILRELSVRGRHTKIGAIVGGIVGAGAGILVGMLSNAICEGGGDCQGASPYLIAIPLFGAGGALLGAGVGSAFPKWKRLLP